MNINGKNTLVQWISLGGFFIILALPILTIPPYFFPADWGKTIVFRSLLAIICLIAIAGIFFQKKFEAPPFKKNVILWILAALLGVFLLASIFSVDPHFSFWGSPHRSGGFINFAAYIIFAVVLFALLKKEHWKWAWDFSIIIGTLVCVVAVIQYYSFFNQFFAPAPDRPSSTLGNPNLLAAYILLLLIPTITFALREKIPWKKYAYCAVALLFSFVILITGSRAVYAGVLMGGLYFLLLYPKKIRIVKISAIVAVLLLGALVWYANTANIYPSFLAKNQLFNSITNRLSISLFLGDPRFSAWPNVDIPALVHRPWLGYGPENFSVGFDKYYNPAAPYLSQDYGDWWDRAHNILLDIGMQAGVFAIGIYLALFAALMWQLHKTKKRSPENNLIAHGLQATLIAYFIANFFSFDSFSSFLLFFFIIGYILHVTSPATREINIAFLEHYAFAKGIVLTVLGCAAALFLWQYNAVPLYVNAQVNTADTAASQKYCDQALQIMNTALKTHSIMDSYMRLEYVEITKTCQQFYPENTNAYLFKGLQLIQEALKIQPLYTRYWIYMGSSTAVIADREKDPKTKTQLLQAATQYFAKASELSPRHQEIPIEEAKMEIAAQDYQQAYQYAQQCVALYAGLGECYWYRALPEIYQNNVAEAQKNIQTAADNFFNIGSVPSLLQLSNAYGSIQDYKDLVPVYERLIVLDPTNAQYHSSLAFFYRQTGDYKKARDEALAVLKISPQSKASVDAFLKTLP